MTSRAHPTPSRSALVVALALAAITTSSTCSPPSSATPEERQRPPRLATTQANEEGPPVTPDTASATRSEAQPGVPTTGVETEQHEDETPDEDPEESEAAAAPEADGLFPPGGAQLLTLLHQGELREGACTLPEREGSWAQRLQGAAWTPGVFPGDALRDDEEAQRRYALTFDDGPHHELTPGLLDLLNELEVRATFFVLGSRITHRTYALIQRIVSEGHTLGNHSYAHDTAEAEHRTEAWGQGYLRAAYRLTQIRVDMALAAADTAEFRRLDRAIFGDVNAQTPPHDLVASWPQIEAAYARALPERANNPLRPGRMFFARPPGGNPWFGDDLRAPFRVEAATAMRDLGLAVVLWDIDSRDWWYVARVDDESEVVKGIAEEVLGASAPEGVILFHDRVPLSALRYTHELLRVSRASGEGVDDNVDGEHLDRDSFSEAGESAARMVSIEALVAELWGCDREALAELLTTGGLERALEDVRRLHDAGAFEQGTSAPR